MFCFLCYFVFVFIYFLYIFLLEKKKGKKSQNPHARWKSQKSYSYIRFFALHISLKTETKIY